MSRTDKDAPNWVRALHDPRRIIDHALGCEHAQFYRWQSSRATRHTCTIDDPRNDHTWKFCHYWVDDRTLYRYTDGPDRDMLRTCYFGPERAAVRDSLRDAARDYNTHHDLDNLAADPPTRQARTSAWTGGWWN